MKSEFEKCLTKYARLEIELRDIDRRCSDIISVSAVGQAPPIFHRLVDKELKIMEKQVTPLWDAIRNHIIPGSDFKTFWQETHWTFGTLPPRYGEIEEAITKYAGPDFKIFWERIEAVGVGGEGGGHGFLEPSKGSNHAMSRVSTFIVEVPSNRWTIAFVDSAVVVSMMRIVVMLQPPRVADKPLRPSQDALASAMGRISFFVLFP